MRDITLKPTTLRSAQAAGFIQLPPDVVARVHEGRVAKGDVREAAKIAGMMAVKKTSELLPHCHPIGILKSDIAVEVADEGIAVAAEVQTIAATGVEMEALTAVSVALLTVYDMLKPYAPAESMVIDQIRLQDKKGGKSHFKRQIDHARAVVIVLSDTVAAGKKQDTAGASVRDGLLVAGFDVVDYDVLPDEPAELQSMVRAWVDKGVELVITVGGTGLGPRDKTIEAIQPLITTDLPGFMEAARSFGQDRTPYAMLSRGIAGLSGNTFIATFPGSRKGAEETLAAVLPGMVHLVEVCRKLRPHEGGYA